MIPQLHSQTKQLPSADLGFAQKQLNQLLSDRRYIQKETHMPPQTIFQNSVIEKLNPLSLVGNKPVQINNKPQLQQYSLVPLVRTIVLQNLQYLSQIQFQYDFFEKNLMACQNGKRITSLVNEVMQKQDLQEIYNLLLSNQKQKNIFAQEVCEKSVLPILQKSFKIFKKFHLQIQPSMLQQLLWNYDVDSLLTSKQKFRKQQTKILKQALKLYATERSTNKKEISNDIRAFFGNHLMQRKEKSMEDNLFFGTVEPKLLPNHIFSDINNAFSEQISFLKNLESMKSNSIQSNKQAPNRI